MEPSMEYKRSAIYKQGNVIGKGGFALVYQVSLEGHPHIVYADKVISKQSKGSSNHVNKIRNEIALHRKLSHPNIVRFIESFEDLSHIHILLELCSKQSLLVLIKQKATLSEDDTRKFLLQICSGVQYLHARRIVHRDLKLGNMLLTHDLQVKIGDFGLACHIDKMHTGASLCGTPNYIAPEVLKKNRPGAAADLWAIGCMAFAMVAGYPPFETRSLNETYTRIAENNYTLGQEWSCELKSFITKLLQPDPNRRGSLLGARNLFLSDFFSYSIAQCKTLSKLLFGWSDSDHVLCPTSAPVPTFVTKWIDYSNKHGFGYKLTNGSFGILHNDKTQCCEAQNKQYLFSVSGKSTSWRKGKVAPKHMYYSNLLKLFSDYMSENLAEGTYVQDSVTDSTPILVQGWNRSETCVVMVLSNSSIQINFLKTHHKIVFSEDNFSLLVTFIFHQELPITFVSCVKRTIGNSTDHSKKYNQLISLAISELQKHVNCL